MNFNVKYLQGRFKHLTQGTLRVPQHHLNHCLNPKARGQRVEPATLSQPVDPSGVGGFNCKTVAILTITINRPRVVDLSQDWRTWMETENAKFMFPFFKRTDGRRRTDYDGRRTDDDEDDENDG